MLPAREYFSASGVKKNIYVFLTRIGCAAKRNQGEPRYNAGVKDPHTSAVHFLNWREPAGGEAKPRSKTLGIAKAAQGHHAHGWALQFELAVWTRDW